MLVTFAVADEIAIVEDEQEMVDCVADLAWQSEERRVEWCPCSG